MARAICERGGSYEPLYDKDPRSGATIEVFWADTVLARSFGTRAGWFSWSCQPGALPDDVPRGPFPTSYTAYRDAMNSRDRLFVKGLFSEQCKAASGEYDG